MAWIRNTREPIGEIETARGYAQKPRTKKKCGALAAATRPLRRCLKLRANGSSLLLEARYRFGFAVIHVENRQQLGDLKNFLELGAQVAQL